MNTLKSGSVALGVLLLSLYVVTSFGDDKGGTATKQASQELTPVDFAETLRNAKKEGKSEVVIYTSARPYAGQFVEVVKNSQLAHIKSDGPSDIYLDLSHVEAVTIYPKQQDR